uniref:N-acetyltransferase domain-containing protein n=1 Tax=Thermogemmatispora argillosa TaxID=2045280 RepID=A0A455T5X2_9CHLR|nr:hypothetical protein KTA_30510 [Thermogemmatispora argillosa]
MSALLHGLRLTAPDLADLGGVLQLFAVCDYGLSETIDGYGTLLTAEEAWLIKSGCEEPIAYADLHTQRIGQEEAAGLVGLTCLLRLLVHPHHRRRGLATLLLRLAEEKARQLVRGLSPLPEPGNRKPARGWLCIPVLLGRDSDGAQVFLKREGYVFLTLGFCRALLPFAAAGYCTTWQTPMPLPGRPGPGRPLVIYAKEIASSPPAPPSVAMRCGLSSSLAFP